MKTKIILKLFRQIGFVLTAVLLTVSASFAYDAYLVAQQFAKTMPDGATINMWGFAPADNTFAPTGPATAPGPLITVQPGDAVLNIHVKNNLAVPISIVIPGQFAPMAPVKTADVQGRQRVVSFTAETAAGATGNYTWSNVKPGTYLYMSGTNPALQVQMGLYGAVKKNAGVGTAYPGVTYDNEMILLYSEIDPALHPTETTPAAAGRPLTYKPKYFLINGDPFPAAAPVLTNPLLAGDRVLIRFLSACQENHVPTLQGSYMSLIAEDGNPYPYPKQQYGTLLAPGKTLDAIWNPTKKGTYPLYDRRFFLTNNEVSGGGMLVSLGVGGLVGASPDSYSVNEDTPLIVAAPGVLANDRPATGLSARVVGTTANGTLAFNADGSFTYTPNLNFVGLDAFTYEATMGAEVSNTGTVTIAVLPVNDPPAAAQDAYTAMARAQLTVAAPGVLANDTDAEGNPLTAVLVTPPAAGTLTLNANGSFTYLHPTNVDVPTPVTFTYKANDGSADSAETTVTITVNPNQPPVGIADAYTATATVPLAVAAPGVLANDTDVEGNALTAVLVTPPAAGTLTLNPDGSFSYLYPTDNINVATQYTFTYTADDGLANSAPATVTLTVLPFNNAPVANADGYPAFGGATLNVAAPGVLANDTDVEGNPLTAVLVSPPATGALTLNANGSFTYKYPLNANAQETFTYKANDGRSDSNPVTVTLTISSVINRPPVAVADKFNVPRNTTSTINIIANDYDPDSFDAINPASITIVQPLKKGGTLVVNADGTVTYTPLNTFRSDDEFQYNVKDGYGATSNTVKVKVVVQ